MQGAVDSIPDAPMSISFPVLPVILPIMQEGVIALDKDGVVRMANDAAARLVRLDEAAKGDRLVGRELVTLCKLEALSKLAEEVLFDGEEFRGEITNDTGHVRRVDVALVPKSKKGKVIGAVILLLDRTDVFRLERVRQDFVANVSHELRTPIAAIRGWSETLANGPFELPEFVREQLLTIQRNSDRLTALVNDLLTLAKAEAIGLHGDHVRVDLSGMIAEIVQAHEASLAAKGLAVQVIVDDEVESIHSEPRALEYILRNLIENAVKYSTKGGEIVVRAQRRKKGRLRISVQDDGMGIEKHHLPRLFERFYRVDEGRSRAEGGTGLGLAIVKHFASSLGGDVRVYSEPGKGSEFAVRLPRESWELPD